MALWKRASKYYVEFTAPDGTRVRRSTGTSDRRKAEEYHDRLKAELWEASRLKKKPKRTRSEEHTSELQSLMRSSYAVFCLKKKNHPHDRHTTIHRICNKQTTPTPFQHESTPTDQITQHTQ